MTHVFFLLAISLGAGLTLYALNYPTYGDLLDESGSLGWAFWIGWIGVVFYIVAGGALLAETVQALRSVGGYYPLGNGFL